MRSAIDQARNLAADDNATRIGDSLKHIAAEAGTMPLGAVVLLSDGGDNTGGVDRDTICAVAAVAHSGQHDRLRAGSFRQRYRDCGCRGAGACAGQSRVSARVAIRQHGLCGAEGEADGARERPSDRPAGDHAEAGRRIRAKPSCSMPAPAGAHSFQIGIDPHAGRSRMRRITRRSAGQRDAEEDAHPLFRGRAAMGIQVHPARGGRRSEHRDLSAMVRTTQNKTYRAGRRQCART